jgi:nucleoside-diphosphate kinase
MPFKTVNDVSMNMDAIQIGELTMPDQKIEQTLVLIKPDALKLSLTGYVLSQLSELNTGLRISATKIVNVTNMLAGEHYAEHRGKFFYPSLLDYIAGRIHYPSEPEKRRVKTIVYQGVNAVEKIRKLAGPTNPHVAREKHPGCIRSMGTVIPIENEAGQVVGERMDNLIHASATPQEAEREIKLWLKPDDIPPLVRLYNCQQADEHFYFKDDHLIDSYQPGSLCVVAPGDYVWETDLQALGLLRDGLPSAYSLQSVVAKYLINREPED